MRLRVSYWLREARVHQWAKNILVLLPLILAHNFTQVSGFFSDLLSFLAFSFSASAIYVINDLRDLSSDRQNPTKSSRPLAAGLIDSQSAKVGALILAVGGVTLSLALGTKFFLVILLYLISTTLYSWKLKQIVIVDVVLLASFYVLRIWAGGIAADVKVSYWLFGFSIFFFLSMAFAKRYSELFNLERAQVRESTRRGYVFTDRPLLLVLGISSGYAAIVILVLYLNSSQVQTNYQSPQILWALIPIATYWISWNWLQAFRGYMDSDPLLFAMKMNENRITLGLAALVFVAANLLSLNSGIHLVQ